MVMNIPHVWKIEGVDPNGPNTCVFGGVHGDETIGVAVVERLREYFGLEGAPYGVYKSNEVVRGNLFLGIGNPVAVSQKTRAAGKGPDLNRSFSQKELDRMPFDHDRYDLTRARELMPLFRKTDFLFDIHSTSSKSVPFVCMGNDSPLHREFYQLIPAQYVLTDPDTILPKDSGRDELGTTDYAVNVYGGSAWSERQYGYRRGIAMAYESGQADELHKEKEVMHAAFRFMKRAGTIDNLPGFVLPHTQRDQRVFKLSAIIHAQHNGFKFLEHMREGWQLVKQGDKLGVYPAVNTYEYIQHGGMLLFPKGRVVLPEGR
jgi:predicted deacylase